MSSRVGRLLETLTALSAVVTLPAGILAALFMGLSEAAVVFVVGWLFLVPVFGVLEETLVQEGEETDEQESPDESTADPLDELKRRYANGEIDEAEFERRVERLVAIDEIPPGAISGGADDADGADALDDSEGIEEIDSLTTDEEDTPRETDSSEKDDTIRET